MKIEKENMPTSSGIYANHAVNHAFGTWRVHPWRRKGKEKRKEVIIREGQLGDIKDYEGAIWTAGSNCRNLGRERM